MTGNSGNTAPALDSKSSALPKFDSPNLGLVHPTKEELVVQMRKNGSSWRGALSLEAYLRREEHLASQRLTRENGITYWVLVDITLNHKNRVVLAGCETLRKRALMSKDGKVTEVVCHGVGSVFTPDEFRGRGYGRRMMQDLGAKLRHYQTERMDCMLSVLYSDIGKTFYAERGWIPCPSAHVHVPPVADSKPMEGYPTAMPLYEKDLPKLCAKDEAMMYTTMSNWRGSTAVALIPDYKTVEWHHARETFVANELYGVTPSIKGAIVHIGEHRIWAIWTRMWGNDDASQTKGNTLYVLRLVVENGNSYQSHESTSEEYVKGIAAILHVAQVEAHKWHCEAVEIWNPQKRTMMAAQRLWPEAAETHREKDSITSLKWYGPESQIDWLENEKYGWC